MASIENEEDMERANLYKLLASFFLGTPAEEAIGRLAELEEFTITESPHDIGHDFHDLFAHNAVPLYESFYNYPVGGSPRPWGNAAGDVRSFYESVGLTVDEELHIIADHLAAELIFMSYLIENDFVEEQRKFLELHLMKWVPLFCDEVQKHAKTDFYRHVAILLKELVSSDNEYLKEV